MKQFLFFLSAVVFATSLLAEDRNDPFDHWPTDLRINGKMVVGSNLSDESVLRDSLAKRDLQGKVSLLVDRDLTEEEFLGFAKVFGSASQYSVVRRERDSDFSELSNLLLDCNTFLWRPTQSIDERQAKQMLQHRDAFARVLERGGTLVFLGPAADIAGAIVVRSDKGVNVVHRGLGLMPDCLLDFGDGPIARKQILDVLDDRPTTVGIGVAKGTLLSLSGRILSTTGPGTATLLIASMRNHDSLQTKTISQRESRRQSANDFLADLTQWRRRAIDQKLPPFPAGKPSVPRVENGTLVIVGGGGMPEGLMSRFVELAGGVDQAKLVYVPCSEQRVVSDNQSTVNQWKRMGVKNATFIHTKDRMRAHFDDDFLAPLKEATGIWFGGGRQWNFADSYYGTRAQVLMQQVLHRGGVVGGSSAGASIQASFLARATPIENYEILAPGYLRGGLGFLSGVAIDQHFSQRGRQKDMTKLVDRYPQMLGIGIDEGTALIVKESTGTVVGKGDVYFYDRRVPTSADEPDYVKLAAGSTYELDKRTVLSAVDRVDVSTASE